MHGRVTDFDLAMMRLAIDQALNAATLGEVPVGAVVVRDGQVVATGFNHPIGSCDPTAHAEIRALRAASEHAGNYRLPDCDLYVTLEPCIMCAGAILHARIRRLFYGARDPKTGACGSVVDVTSDHRINHQTTVMGGVLESDCGQMLSRFFGERRHARRARRDATGARIAGGIAAEMAEASGTNENAVARDGIEIEFLEDPPDS